MRAPRVLLVLLGLLAGLLLAAPAPDGRAMRARVAYGGNPSLRGWTETLRLRAG